MIHSLYKEVMKPRKHFKLEKTLCTILWIQTFGINSNAQCIEFLYPTYTPPTIVHSTFNLLATVCFKTSVFSLYSLFTEDENKIVFWPGKHSSIPSHWVLKAAPPSFHLIKSQKFPTHKISRNALCIGKKEVGNLSLWLEKLQISLYLFP